MSRLDLCIVTVYGPAKIAAASPFSQAQLAKKSESWAEKRRVSEELCPRYVCTATAPSSSDEPAAMMKSDASTLAPTYTGASGSDMSEPL